MKKWLTIVSAAMVVILAGLAAYALHPEKGIPAIPYEAIIKHLPFAAGGDLRYHITVHKPYKEWDKWPGKGEMYPGKEPHGALLTTYVNKTALDSIKKAKGMAEDSIIVKENYDSGKKLNAVTVMYKVKNYNPEGGDWFWAKYDPQFNILGEGKVEGCIKCHGSVKDNDYIFTGKVTGK